MIKDGVYKFPKQIEIKIQLLDMTTLFMEWIWLFLCVQVCCKHT